MDALIFATIAMCLWPTEPEHKVCNVVTLSEPFVTVDMCISGWKGAVDRWAGPSPTAPFSAKLMGCGPAPRGTPEDVPMPRMPQRHTLSPGRPAPLLWRLADSDAAITFTRAELVPIEGAGPMLMIPRLARRADDVANVALVIPALGALALAGFDCHAHTFAIEAVGDIRHGAGDALVVNELEAPTAVQATEFTPVADADPHWRAVEIAACNEQGIK